MTAAPVVSVSGFRVGVDGGGIRSPELFHGCPLRCRYCLNVQARKDDVYYDLTPDSLYRVPAADELYFRSAGGGVTFGGGEPALYSSFIKEFAIRAGISDVC